MMIGRDNPIRRLERIDDAEWYEAVPGEQLAAGGYAGHLNFWVRSPDYLEP